MSREPRARRDSIEPCWRDRLAYALLLALVCWLPWPWGSVGTLAQGMVLLLTGLALLLSWSAPDRHWPGHRAFRWALAGWGLWLLWLTLALLPLPPALLGLLSPPARAIHESVAALGVSPAWTLSVEPVASRQLLVATFGLLGLYLLAARSVQSSRRRLGLLVAIAATAGVQAFYGLGMTLSGSEIGFLERKTYGLGWATGTFVNRNHFAHLLALGAAAAVGLLLTQPRSRESRECWRGRFLRFSAWLMSPAAVWRVLLLVLLVAVVLSQSRMGNLVVSAVLVASVLLWILLHDRSRMAPALVLLASFVAADLWIVNRYYGLERVVDRLEDTELATEQRAIALRDLRPLAGQYLATGAGGGSFQSLFMGVQSPELVGLFDHAHNEYVEFLIEHGVPGLAWLLAMGLLHGIHALRLLRRRRNRAALALALAGFGALLAAALHAGTDFVLHIPALRGWLAVLMGALIATGLPRRPADSAPAPFGHNDEAKPSPTSQVA